jgi:hypothetical protein
MAADPDRTHAREFPPPRTAWERLLCRAEEWIYDLNARDHWFFRLYDRCNELWASLAFRGVKRRAASVAVTYPGRGVDFHIRFLGPEDLDAFAELLDGFDEKYKPPHALDRATAEHCLKRRSYLCFGIWLEARLVAYVLVRLFFPFRAVTGGWEVRDIHNMGLGKGAIAVTGSFTRVEGLNDYITAPLDNPNSRLAAESAGWKLVRTNRRFHVLLRQ